jgi:hypothetical protein
MLTYSDSPVTTKKMNFNSGQRNVSLDNCVSFAVSITREKLNDYILLNFARCHVGLTNDKALPSVLCGTRLKARFVKIDQLVQTLLEGTKYTRTDKRSHECNVTNKAVRVPKTSWHYEERFGLKQKKKNVEVNII